jgi:hypothetical protein
MPIVIEPSPGQLASDPGLLPIRQLDHDETRTTLVYIPITAKTAAR